jgi:hypothetical protein
VGRQFDGCAALVWLIYLSSLLVMAFTYAYKRGWLFLYIIPCIALFFIILTIRLFYLKNRIKEELQDKNNRLNCEIRILNKKNNEEIENIKKEFDTQISTLKNAFIKKEKNLTLEFSEKLEIIKKQKQRLQYLLYVTTPFQYSASIIADMKVWVYEDEKRYLRNKSRPAYTAAEIVSQLKKKTHAYIADYKSMLYKYEFLLSTFPELKRYVDDEEALLSLSKVDNYNEFKENRDCCRDYLTDEEYKSLSVIERNQLALDRYKKRPKSNWTVGMLYEMYIGHLLHDQYDVVQFGIINGVEDLGRDIIAKKKYPFGKETTYIIQCKNWSTTKEIHENVVCQIFGTTMEYEIKNKKTLNQEIVPVLCVTTRLSQTAQIFAERLGVKVYVKPMGDFPMIKCNINNGQKIYHLPFDQQYWRTKIEKPGEFYAWTVEEATKKGFRRALKHLNY